MYEMYAKRLLGLALASVWIGGSGQAPLRSDGYAPELLNLQSEYRRAMDAYFAPLQRAKSEEERIRARLDPAKDPSRSFAARFLALARRSTGTETGARSLLAVIECDRSQTPTSQAGDALNELVMRYGNRGLMQEVVDTLRFRPPCVGTARARRALERIVSRSPRRGIRSSALLNLARLELADAGTTDEIRAASVKTLRRLKRDFADTPAGRAAEHDLFEIDHLQAGMEAPDFEAVDDDGRPFKLSDFRGKVVVIVFWGSWSTASRATVTSLRRLAVEQRESPFGVVAINGDVDRSAARKLAKTNVAAWRNGVDGLAGASVATKWNVSMWPTLFVLDAKGVIRYRDVGERDVEAAVRMLLKGAEGRNEPK